jgi:hypothetical protein
MPIRMLFWTAENPADAGAAMISQSKRGDGIAEIRRTTSLRYASLYEGVELGSLSPHGYAADSECGNFFGDNKPLIRNTCHAAVDTFTAKIAAIDTPKPAMLTTEGSWRDRRQAKDLERLVEAEYMSPKGDFATLHELWIHAFRLAAAATGAVLVHFYQDGDGVGARIHDTLDACISGDGSWVILKTWYEVDDAVELFPDDEAEIRKAATKPPLEYSDPQTGGHMTPEKVCIYQGWRGAHGDEPGCYVVAVDGKTLDYGEYPHERPPVVKLVITPHLYGPWGHSLTHHMYESIRRDNLILQSIDRSVSKSNRQMTFVEQDKLKNPDALAQAEDNIVIYTNEPVQPHIVTPQGFHPQHLALAEQHRADAHAIAGVSEMHSAGRKEPGLDSGIAQRYVAALINERFAAVQRRYVQAVAVDSAKVIIQILCDIYQDNPKLTRHWPGQDSLREVSASVALHGIEALKYVIRPAAVSGSKGSPAERQQAAFELFKSGVLSNDALAGLQSNGYDLPEEISERDTQREWLDAQLDKYMFASDDEVQRPDFYEPPLRHINVPRALVRTIDGFLEARMEKLESERQEFYLMLLADLDSLLAETANTNGQLPQSPQPTQPTEMNSAA